MKVALIHDHLAQLGGAEKVLQALAEIYPQAPIFTLLYNSGYANKYFPGRDIRKTIIQSLPLGVRRYQWYMPLMPMAIESHDLQDYNLVISSASSFAKGVITRPDTTHVCYCHTPTRYLWHYSNQYIDELRMAGWLKKLIGLYVSKIRQWDKIAADRVDYFIANSRATQARIKKYYNRESIIIYPPVATVNFKISANIGDYFLAGARFIPHKRLDLAIEAFNKLNLPLKIFGDGPDLPRLRKIARRNIEFLGRIDENAKNKLMSGCQAFIHPQEEDFGITAVEAQASGRPVIAYAKGGASETVIDKKTGLFFYEQTWEELADAVLHFKYGSNSFDPYFIKKHAEQFGEERFRREIIDYINMICHPRAGGDPLPIGRQALKNR